MMKYLATLQFRKVTRSQSSIDLDKVRAIWRDRWQETYQAMQDRISHELEQSNQL